MVRIADCPDMASAVYRALWMLMPSLHLVYDELPAIVQCLNSHFRAISVRRSYDIERFLGVVGSS